MVAVNPVTDLALDGEVAVVTLNSPPVNALSKAVREGLTEAFRRAVADPQAKAIVLICAGRTFIAGADISELDGGGKVATIEELQALMEGSPKPVVAAIHGTALGGGLEVALCAHYRIAENGAKCGLPEVKLGLLPGGGGTQRLPRAVGVENALEMVTSGRHVAADECLAMGLVDALAPEGKLRESALAFARRATDAPPKRVRDMSVVLADPDIFDHFRAAHADEFRGFDAPEANIRCIEAAARLPIEEGLKVEHELFLGLLRGEQSAAQRYIFFAERQAGKVPDIPDGTPAAAIRKVGTIGDAASAKLFAAAGISVSTDLGGCDLIVADDIEAAAARVAHPEIVIGISDNGTRLVEIARGDHTAKEIVVAAMKLARAAGKLAVVTGPGFIGPRLMAARRRAEEALLRDGATARQIALALESFSFPAEAVADADVLNRILRAVLDEGARILEEKNASRASDIDVAMVNGYGWPVYRGGPMFQGARRTQS